MAVERKPEFVINLGEVIQERLRSLNEQRELIRAREEIEFQTRIIEEGLSAEEQLKYRQQQLERELSKNYPDQNFILSLKKEIATLKKMVRQRKFRDEYLAFLQEAAAGRKSIADEINFLQGELVDAIDEETKDSIRQRIIELTEQKRNMDRAITEQQLEFYENDKTLDSYDMAINLVKDQLSKIEVIKNPEIANAYRLKLQALQQQRAQAVVENKINNLNIELSRASDYLHPSLMRITKIGQYLTSADETTPITINGVRYASEKEFWQTTLDNYVNSGFANDFVNEITKNATILKSSKGKITDGFLDTIFQKLQEVKNNPLLANYKNVITDLSQQVESKLLTEKADEVKNKYNLGTSLATRFDVWKAKNELSKYSKYFSDISLEPILKQFDTMAAEEQFRISQETLQAATEYQIAHPEVSLSEAIKKVAPLVGTVLPQEEFMKPKTTEELGKKLAEVSEKPAEALKTEQEMVEEVKKTPEPIEPLKKEETPKEEEVLPTEIKKTEEPEMITHTVKEGETLWSIAKKYLGSGTRWKELLKPEGTPFTTAEAKKLQVGQTIKVPKIK